MGLHHYQRKRQRRGHPRRHAPLARGFRLIVLTLTAFALYIDLSSGVGIAKRQTLGVVARQTRGVVAFEAYETAWLSQWWQPETTSLRVLDWIEGTPLWETEAASTRHVVVTYGQVPTGYVQTIPGCGAPQPLTPGVLYGVTVRGRGGSAQATFNKVARREAG